MVFDTKQKIRGIKIFLTVFYGFLLSSILFRYLVHGIVIVTRSPVNPFAISLIIIGTIVLISIGLSIYATWSKSKKVIILIISGVVLIFVFILTLVFGILRILKSASYRSNETNNSDGSDSNSATNVNSSDGYALAEDVIGLIIELISILFAILGTFVLYRYWRNDYGPVAKNEAEAAKPT